MQDSPDVAQDFASLRALMPWLVRRSSTDLQRARGAYRNPHARDRARVMHSRSFRCLQGKQSWMGLDEGEVMRSRMTQTLEAAQLSRGLLRALQGLHSPSEAWVPLLPDPNLIEAIAFARHMGAPAFGRSGETALNFLMRHHGGFESGAQSLRLLARCEPYEEGFGLDLSRRVLLGALQHPASLVQLRRHEAAADAKAGQAPRRADWHPPHGFYAEDQTVVNWILMPMASSDSEQVLKPQSPATALAHGHAGPGSLDSSIVSTAADIAAGCHEFEDGIALGAIRHADWQALTPDHGWASAVDLEDFDELGQQLFNGSVAARKRALGTLINAFVVSVEVEPRDGIQEPLMRWQAQLMPQARDLLAQLREVVSTRVCDHLQVQAHEQTGATLLGGLFTAYANDPQTLLPPDVRTAHAAAESDAARMRLIADHVAGLSDAQVSTLHARLHR